MREEQISEVMERYVQNEEIAGASLLVRQHGQTVYRNCWGYADKSARMPIREDSIFRLMSMTKCVTAVGILQLMEAGKLNLDDPLSLFIPSFAKPRVAADARYRWHDGVKMGELLWKALFFRMERVKTVPAEREITIRDLLSHSSGLEQGMVGLLAMLKDRRERVDLVAQAERYAQYPLDFQPGCGTGYSPLAGFDVLARVIEVLSGMDAAQYYKANIFQPLGMQDTAFHLNEEQKKRLVHVYCRKNGKLVDVTGSKENLPKKFHFGERYICGAGGLYATLTDYGAFAQMLQNGGSYRGTQILKSETVQLLRTEAPVKHLEPAPGFVWGLGVKIRQDPVRSGSAATKGTYGWSGAFGTHFFVSPADNLNCVLMLNRSDLDGAGSYISKKVEELVFGTFAGKGG